MPKRDLLSIEDLSRPDIELLLATAEDFLPVLERDIKKVPTLRGHTVVKIKGHNISLYPMCRDG